MDTDRFARLTDKQRTCLRMVFMHRSSKEIARELGVGSAAVDQRIKTAMRVLGAENRVEAARMLVSYEGGDPYQRLVYETSEVVAADRSMLPPNSVHNEMVRLRGAQGGGNEWISSNPLPWHQPGALSFPLPMEQGSRNCLSSWQRAVWIVVIAIGTAIGFGALLSGLRALAELTGPSI